MTICALDLATTTGFASTSHGILISGSYKCRNKAKEPWGSCFLSFKRWLREWLIQEKPEKLYYEEVRRWSSGDAAKAYCGLRAVMLMECELWGIGVVGVAVGTIKKHATGSGKASKDEMIEAAWRRWGVRCKDDNQADAIAVIGLALDLEKQKKHT
jgi:Holliday junction resolvasome RuvABC endonuclease subunit